MSMEWRLHQALIASIPAAGTGLRLRAIWDHSLQFLRNLLTLSRLPFAMDIYTRSWSPNLLISKPQLPCSNSGICSLH